MMMLVSRIVSGGQTGADRGGLDAAIAHGLAHGGWCPKFRRAEDGEVPACYLLTETEDSGWFERTQWNVRDSDATLVFTRGAMTPGSKRTAMYAISMEKPWLHVNLRKLDEENAVAAIRHFLEKCGAYGWTVNVAGSRDSKSPGIGDEVQRVMEGVLRGE